MSRDLRRFVEAQNAELRRTEVPLDIETEFGQYRNAPQRFVIEVLGQESARRRSTGELYQFAILSDLARSGRVAVRSGHGVGKTTGDAWAAIWWTVTRPYSRVVVVAPEFQRQVKGVLFAEIRKQIRRSRRRLPLDPLTSRVVVSGHGEEWGVLGMPATEPDRLEGVHAEGGVLLIIDESKGVPAAVYDALQGALTGHAENAVLITSTPGPPSGFFYELCTTHRASWKVHHIPSTDSSLVDPAWVEARREDWGEGSPLFLARVMGIFPEEGEGSLFRLSDLEAAVDRELERPEKTPGTVLGVDCARFGPDRSAIAKWTGPRLDSIETRKGLDVMEVASWVQSAILRLRPGAVRIDEIGIGAGVVDRVRQLNAGLPGLRTEVTGVNVGSRAEKADVFLNVRAEALWRLRQAFEQGTVSIARAAWSDQLIAELAAHRYRYTANGRIQIEDKDDIKKRVGRSPDLADAVALGYWATLPTKPRRPRLMSRSYLSDCPQAGFLEAPASPYGPAYGGPHFRRGLNGRG